MTTKTIKPLRLFYEDVQSAGKQIHGFMDTEFNCVEFKKRVGPHMVATEPWIQFEPPEWKAMMDKLFAEMVEAWNEKHATIPEAEMDIRIKAARDRL